MLLVASIAGFLLFGGSSYTGKPITVDELAGEWVGEADGVEYRYTFEKAGTGSVSAVGGGSLTMKPFKFELQSRRGRPEITVQLGGTSERCPASLDADGRLTLEKSFRLGSGLELRPAPVSLTKSKPEDAGNDENPTGPQGATLDRSRFVGKWLMSDGVIEFKDDGTFLNIGDRHQWEFSNGDLFIIVSGKKEKRKFDLKANRLTLLFENGNRAGALRLGSKEFSHTGQWTIPELAGEWAAGDSIKLTLDARGSGSCNSRISLANGLANFEFSSVAVYPIGDTHTIKIQKMNWVLRLSKDRKTLDLVAADDAMLSTSTITLHKK